jgi:hypothetical protein
MSNPDDTHKIHHNWPQITVNLVRTQIMICLWGRGTGKTEGPIADFVYENVRLMPRSLGAIVSVTYEKMLTFIIPKLIKAWERIGYLMEVHYWVRKTAPEHLRIKMPYLPVANTKQFIHHANGAGNICISMDRKGTGNAGDIDYIAGDEMRFVKRDNFDEVLNANRGNVEHFGHLSAHHSVLLTSDMPQDMKGRWLLEFAELVDEQVIDAIISIQQKLFELQEKLQNTRSKAQQLKIQRIIDKWTHDLNELRVGEVYVSYASTFDNVHALGLDAIKNLRRTLSDYIWQLSVLNKKVAIVENGFYPLFDDSPVDEGGMTYTATDHRRLDALEITDYSTLRRDSTWDTDCRNDQPLHLAMDHNKSITWIVIGQIKSKSNARRVIQVQNSIYVKDPQRIRHAVDLFVAYYKPRMEINKTIYYYYDHNSVGEDSSRDYSFADEVFQQLSRAGFLVVKKYIGKAPTHKAKYELIHDMMEGRNPKLPKFEINSTNNETLIDAIKQTDVKIGGRSEGFEKNKDRETDKSFPQELAPHGTDALDILICGIAQKSHFSHSGMGGVMTEK